MIERMLYGRRNGKYNYCEFQVDTVAELEQLPTCNTDNSGLNICAVGSRAIVLANQSVYAMSGDGEWKFLYKCGASGGGGGSADWTVTDDGEGNVTIM